MLGIVVALAISWVLLYLMEKKNILALGLQPMPRRLKQFLLGLLLTAILCFGVQYLEMLLASSNWVPNENFTWRLILEKLRWDFISVVTEELVFRGALLFILIKKIGTKRGILVSAIAFGIYHWFSFGILGNIVAMIFVFMGTGLMGYAWALAFSKTESMWMPVGLHLGWNFTFNSVFSKGSLGQGMIITQGGHRISDWFSLVGLILVPIIVFVFIKIFIPKEDHEFKERIVREIPL